MLVWYINVCGDPAAAVLSGITFLHNGQMAIHRGRLLPPLKIPLSHVWRAKEVPQDLKDILKMADFYISGTVRELSPAGSQQDWF